MKSKIFTKLLCLALCLVTIFCSGCFGDYIGNDPEKIQELIDTMQKRKEESQAFIPQCTDYTFKIAYGNVYLEKELFEQQGFYTYKYLSVGQYDWTTNIFSEFQIIESLYDDDEQRTLRSIIFSAPFNEENIYGCDYFIFDRFGGGTIMEFDNHFFFVTPTFDQRKNLFEQKAPAFYLIDFENQQLLYCGCALEFYDLFIYGGHIELRYIEDLFYKIEKNTGENGNEENS